MEQWSEAYELAQSAALRENGWWSTAVKRALEHCLFDSPRGLSRSALINKTLRILRTDDMQSVTHALEDLKNAGSIQSTGSAFLLTEGRRRELKSESEYQTDIRIRVERQYETLCVELQVASFNFPTWTKFHDELVVPLIAELGARTIKLLNGETSAAETRVFARFASKHGPRNRDDLKRLGSRFFDPDKADVRTFLIGKLSGYFLASAGAVSKKALKAFAEKGNNSLELRVVLDTNTIFSILDWHENPANEVSRSLFDLGRRVAEDIKVNFYVLPETLQEARRALEGARDACPFASLTVEQARAVHMTGDLSGLVERYVKSARDRPLSASTYFKDKITYIETQLVGLGIQKLDEDLSALAASSKVERRVNSLMRLSKTWGKNRSKVSIRHDVLMASYVERQRPGEHVLVHEAEWWFLTVDASLRKWERSEMATNEHLPCTILPDELIQILRFWVPRSDELDEALMEGIRLEFEFFDYDNRAQSTSLSILGTLNEVTQGNEMSADATLKILLDKNVRSIFEKEGASEAELSKAIEISAVKRVAELETQLELVREQSEENLKESKDVSPHNGSSRRKSGKSKDTANLEASTTSTIESMQKKLQEERKLRERAETRLNESLAEKDQAESSLGEVVRQLREESDARKDLTRKTMLIVACAVLLGVVFLGWHLWGRWTSDSNYLQLLVLIILGVSFCMKVLPAASEKYLINPDWKVRKFCEEHRRPLTYAVIGAALGVPLASFF